MAKSYQGDLLRFRNTTLANLVFELTPRAKIHVVSGSLHLKGTENIHETRQCVANEDDNSGYSVFDLTPLA